MKLIGRYSNTVTIESGLYLNYYIRVADIFKDFNESTRTVQSNMVGDNLWKNPQDAELSPAQKNAVTDLDIIVPQLVNTIYNDWDYNKFVTKYFGTRCIGMSSLFLHTYITRFYQAADLYHLC